MVKIPTGTWILVADGTKARLFSNVGTATAPSRMTPKSVSRKRTSLLKRRATRPPAVTPSEARAFAMRLQRASSSA